jgi:hypothetical protein
MQSDGASLVRLQPEDWRSASPRAWFSTMELVLLAAAAALVALGVAVLGRSHHDQPADSEAPIRKHDRFDWWR